MTGVSLDRGVERIAEAFERARADGRRAALMPYMMGGYPSVDASLEIARAYVEGGADLIELGVPFSDPLADGPVIHAAAVEALAGGARLADCLAVARSVSGQVPIVVMCYVNPILARGVERFCDLLVEAGVCGLIVPDLPLEESELLYGACEARGLALVPLVAPTTPDARMTQIGERARGFLYVVSVAGTTGERSAGGASFATLLERARAAAQVPVALGFGIGTPEAAAAAAADGADGVIVGSRFVRAAAELSPTDVRDLVASFAAALR
jgi:tryptophan synthase alpha chain